MNAYRYIHVIHVYIKTIQGLVMTFLSNTFGFQHFIKLLAFLIIFYLF